MSIIMIWVFTYLHRFLSQISQILRYDLVISCFLVLESFHFDSVIRLGSSISSSALSRLKLREFLKEPECTCLGSMNLRGYGVLILVKDSRILEVLLLPIDVMMFLFWSLSCFSGMNYTLIRDELIVGSQPQKPEDIDHLKQEENVAYILNLQQDKDIEYWGIDLESIVKRCKELGIRHMRRPVRNISCITTCGIM